MLPTIWPLIVPFTQGTFGALGHGDENNRDTPQLLKQLWHVGIVMVRHETLR